MAAIQRLKIVVDPKTGATETVEAMPTMRIEEIITSVAYRHPKVFNLIGLSGYELVVTTSSPMIWLDRKECISTYFIDPDNDVLQLVSRSTRKAICGKAPQFRSTPGAISLSKVIIPEESVLGVPPASGETTLVAGLNAMWGADTPAPSVCDLIPDEAREYTEDPYKPTVPGSQTAFSIVSPLEFDTFSEASDSAFAASAAEAMAENGGDDSSEQEGSYEEVTKRRAQTISPLVLMNEHAKSSLQGAASAEPWEREISQYEVLLWPHTAPFVRGGAVLCMKVLIPHLKLFKTLVFDGCACVEDAVILLWEDLFINHSWDAGSHWSQWALTEQGSDTPLHYGLLLANALSSSDGHGKPWWTRTFCFVQRGCEPFIDIISDHQLSESVLSAEKRRECICVVSFPENDEKVVVTARTSAPLADVVESARRQTRYGSRRPFDIAAHSVIVVGVKAAGVSECECPFPSVIARPGALLGDYLDGDQSTVIVECRLKPQKRVLHAVFGVSYCVMVKSPSEQLGVYIYNNNSTVQSMLNAAARDRKGPAAHISRYEDSRRPQEELPLASEVCSLRLVEGEELTLGTPLGAAVAPVSNPKLKDPDPPLLSGEEKYVTIHAVLVQNAKTRINGLFLLTSYRIIFSDQGKSIAEIPMASICGVTRGTQTSALIVFAKNVRIAVFLMGQGDLDRIIKTLRLGTKELIYNSFIPRTTSDTFAWANTDAYTTDGWRLYDIDSEYARIGFQREEWRITDANKDFAICDTYPRRFVVPKAISDDDVAEIAKFRARGRIPVVCWVHRNGASLSRCAQPVVKFAVSKRRCVQDEKFIRTLIELAPRSKTLYIFDARANIAATANKVSGKGGTETNTQAYPNCVLNFLDIGNIHALRDSYFKLWDLCVQRQTQYWESAWLRLFVATGWLDHVYHILRGSAWMSDLLSRGYPVITHCSDGWDRTPQLSSLCQIMQDSFFSK